jgi:hypothetical protein
MRQIIFIIAEFFFVKNSLKFILIILKCIDFVPKNKIVLNRPHIVAIFMSIFMKNIFIQILLMSLVQGRDRIYLPRVLET